MHIPKCPSRGDVRSCILHKNVNTSLCKTVPQVSVKCRIYFHIDKQLIGEIGKHCRYQIITVIYPALLNNKSY